MHMYSMCEQECWLSLSSSVKNSKSMSSVVWLSEYKCLCDRAVFSWLWSAIYQVCEFTVHSRADKVGIHSVCVYMCLHAFVCAGEKEEQTDSCIFSLSAWSDTMVVWLEEAQWSILIDDSSQTLFLNEGLTHIHRHVSTLMHSFHSNKHWQTHTLASTQAPQWNSSVHTDTHCEVTVSPVETSWATDSSLEFLLSST